MAGAPMKPATNWSGGVVVEFGRGTDLGDKPVLHHHNAVGERHRLDLVVGDVNRRDVQGFLQSLDLDAHLVA